MKKIWLFLFHLLVVILQCYTQKEAYNWHFGNHAGFNFINGQPELILNPMTPGTGATSTISDVNGIFLFTTDGESIWNRNNQIMLNGNDLEGTSQATQGVLIVKKPGSNKLYYVFTTSNSDYFPESTPGVYYSIVDMTLDDGLGAVTGAKNVLLVDAWDAMDKIVACKQENSENIWIITRKFKEDAFASFLLTSGGLNTEAIFSPANSIHDKYVGGNIKISTNKKYLVAAYGRKNTPGGENQVYEICSFNANTGMIGVLYTVIHDEFLEYETSTSGVEFSPDSKLLYLSFYDDSPDHDVKLYQYETQYIEDSTQFIQSEIFIGSVPAFGMQLATDGKIYTCYCGTGGGYEEYVNVIHEPWKKGTDCNFETDAVYLGGFGVGYFLPNILLDYLYRFEWEGRCQNEAFVFQPNFIPDPEYIIWNFGDPASGSGNVSYELHPIHYFSAPGEFEVSVYLHYPGGRVEQTSRVVTVKEAPRPDLGEDTLVCQTQDVTLNAGDGEGFYVWSNGSFGENANEITVSDTGTYWVRVEWNDCIAYDTIHISLFTKPEINEDNLSLHPTSCAGETGAITGLSINGEEPLKYYWYDGSGTLIDSTLDLYDLSAGNYFLHIIDGNGCTTITESYTITDAGEVEITTVNKQDTHCNQQMGSISITANTPNPGELLYSIDNGITWQNGNNTFNNLNSGSYFVRVKDENDCEGIWENNPVVVDNIDGPQVTSATSLPEIDHLSNGEIDLQASISIGDLHYSINNGNTFQTNDGHFANLSTGTYYCMIKDDFGCDTSFTLEVELKLSQLIEAIAGDGYTCIGNATVVPLVLNNFTDIFSFNVKLTYDSAVLNCDGYIKAHPVLEDNIQVSIVPNTYQIVVQWQGEQAETLEDNATMLELVFTAKQEGVSGIDWAAEEGESVFYNEQQEEISAEYQLGVLRVYTRPSIFIPDDRQVCEGEYLLMTPFVTGGTGEVSYFWEGPNGFESTAIFVEFEKVSKTDAGNYLITVTDTIDCVESAEVKVTVYEKPAIVFPVEDTIFEQPGFILDAGSGYKYYLWNTGDTTHEIHIRDEGLYTVYITSGEDCKSTDSVTVLWGQSAFYLPNAFTPNGDGLNDEFKPVQRYDFVNSYHLSIFNRWGEMIFETADINKGWDGSYKGNPSQQGSYIYKIVYTAWPNKEEQKVVTGGVMLVR